MDEVEHVALLLTEGRVDGQNAFDEATALLGMSAIAGFTAEHAVANGAFGDVVGRLDAVDIEEGPERVGALEQLRAGPGNLEMGHGGALGQQRLDATLARPHVDAEGVFDSPGAMNVRIRELLVDLNARKMRRYGKSRRELFEQLERAALTYAQEAVGLTPDENVASLRIEDQPIRPNHPKPSLRPDSVITMPIRAITMKRSR